VQYGIILEEKLYTVEKLLVIEVKLEEVNEDKGITLKNTTDDIKIL
jgi:hypothetical protein